VFGLDPAQHAGCAALEAQTRIIAGVKWLVKANPQRQFITGDQTGPAVAMDEDQKERN
jgi:hypothetical protein